MKSEVAAGVIAATPPAALVMILFTITTLAADLAQSDASSGGAALFAAAGVDATTASFDAALQLASDDDVKFRDEYRYTVLHKMQEFHDWPRQIGAAIARGCSWSARGARGTSAPATRTVCQSPETHAIGTGWKAGAATELIWRV